MISKELLSAVLDTHGVMELKISNNKKDIEIIYSEDCMFHINIYELAHKNLKEWAKLKNVFNIIDWSEEPEQIFKKAEELRNEIN